jgi:hypothetical protein
MVQSTSSNFTDFAFVQQTWTHEDNTGRAQGKENSGCAHVDETGSGEDNGQQWTRRYEPARTMDDGSQSEPRCELVLGI